MTSPIPPPAYEQPPRAVLIALADPGSITPRRRDLGPERDKMELLTSWQARALIEAGLLAVDQSANEEKR